MNETVLSVIGLVLVAISLCFSALQTRELAKQSRINNGIGSANALLENNHVAFAWHEQLLADPLLRPYFFDAMPSLPNDANRRKVLTLAELLGDVLECNLWLGKLLPDFTFAHTWYLWPAEMLKQSPVLVEIMERHPGWWPALDELHRQIRAGEALTHPLIEGHKPRWRPSRSVVGGGGGRLRDAAATTASLANDVAAAPPQR
ncbi:hypothetical protein AB0F49_26930 [Micromonospora ureilytica]|uniref:hypothetical protein n=1 Tax=Micromonospora ureilytica TaxID=709868 RepID=UPI0033F489C0